MTFAAGHARFEDDDIVVVHIDLEGTPEREQVEEFQQSIRDMIGDRGPVGLLTTLAAPLFFSADTVDYMDEASDWFDRAAWVVTSPMEQASVRAFRYASRDPRPTLLTDSYDEALEWLRGEGRREAEARRPH